MPLPGADPQGKHELVRQIFAHRNPGGDVLVGLFCGIGGNPLGLHPLLAERGEDFRDVLADDFENVTEACLPCGTELIRTSVRQKPQESAEAA